MNRKAKVELGGAIIEQSLRDVLDYERYGSPPEREKALSYEKKSPTCFATRNDGFDIGCLEGAWEVLYGRPQAGRDFVEAFLEEVNGSAGTLKEGSERALRESLGYCPSKGIPLFVEVGQDEDEEEGGGEGMEASLGLYNQRLLDDAAQQTLDGSLVWVPCSHVEVPLTQAILKKLRQKMESSCFRSVSKDPTDRGQDSLLFAVAATKPCNSATQKRYNQYYLLLLPRKLYELTVGSVMTKELEESLYGFLHVIGSAGKLWRTIQVAGWEGKVTSLPLPEDEEIDYEEEPNEEEEQDE